MGIDYGVIGSPVGIETSAVVPSGKIDILEAEDTQGYRDGDTPYIHLRASAEVTRAFYDCPLWETYYRIICETGPTSQTWPHYHSMAPWDLTDAIVDERRDVQVPCTMPSYPLKITVELLTITGYTGHVDTVDIKEYFIPLWGMPGPTKATITGHVMDGDGRDLLNVKVKINGNIDLTDATGRFYLTGIYPGSYTIEYTKADYHPQSKTISLAEGENPQADVFMEGTEAKELSSLVFIGAGAGVGALGGFFSRNRAIGIPIGTAIGLGLGYASYKIYQFFK